MFRFVCLSTVIGILFFAFVCFWPAASKDHAGLVKVHDAGTLEIRSEQNRLYGVMPADQACRKLNREPHACTAEAETALVAFLHGRQVYCQPLQKTGRDDEKHFISVCYLDRDDIGAWMVDNGWAMADRSADRLHNYGSNEDMARLLRKGFWKRTTSSDTRQR